MRAPSFKSGSNATPLTVTGPSDEMQRCEARSRFRRVLASTVLALSLGMSAGPVSEAVASCGSAACFILTGVEGVQLRNVLRFDLSYSYTPSSVPDGQSGLVAAVAGAEPGVPPLIILNEHHERSGRTEFVTLTVDYGLSDNLTLQLQLPYKNVVHEHDISLGLANRGAGIFEKYKDAGIGDIFVGAKYAHFPTLRSMLVFGFGLFLPTGQSDENSIEGVRQEPTLQLGRDAVGILPSIYQSYQVIPHVLNQFASLSYRHTFEAPDSYQFGDEFTFSVGVNWKAWTRLTLSGQFNYKITLNDSFEAALARVPVRGEPEFGRDLVIIDPEVKRRPVPNTGSTILAFSPGITVDVTERVAAYFFVQVPIVEDFNGALAQDVSFLGGIRMSFN